VDLAKKDGWDVLASLRAFLLPIYPDLECVLQLLTVTTIANH
jgi:hypothetical protein